MLQSTLTAIDGSISMLGGLLAMERYFGRLAGATDTSAH
jgi:hypothetical protein